MGGEIRPFFWKNHHEGYAFLNHGDAESPGIEKSEF